MLHHPTTSTTIRGIPVTVINTRPDIDTSAVLARLERVLALLERAVPHYYRHLRRDFAMIRVQRYACRGAYFPHEHACMVELTFAVNPDFSDAQVAASVVHEAMHARLHRLGFPLEMSDRARQERFCRRAEIELGMAVPGGGQVIERALYILENADDVDVAPVIDERLAAARVAQVDKAALADPAWLRRAAKYSRE